MCEPPTGFEPKRGFRFQREDLERLDKLRHDLIHGDVTPSRLGNVDEDLELLFNTGLFLWAMVNEKYGVKLDPTYFQQPQVFGRDRRAF